MSQNFDDFSMAELFVLEAQTQCAQMSSLLLELERAPASKDNLESLMRSAHSIKGAARIVNLPSIVTLSHALEDFFVGLQKGSGRLSQDTIDLLLMGVDMILSLSRSANPEGGGDGGGEEVDRFVTALESVGKSRASSSGAGSIAAAELKPEYLAGDVTQPALTKARSESLKPPGYIASDASLFQVPKTKLQSDEEEVVGGERGFGSLIQKVGMKPEMDRVSKSALEGSELMSFGADRFVRVSSDNMNRMMGLAGESKVNSRWIGPFAESLGRLKRHHQEMSKQLDRAMEGLSGASEHEESLQHVLLIKQHLIESQKLLVAGLGELELYDRKQTHVAVSLYETALACRMRPFSDGTQGYSRMIRDLARTLGKKVRFEVRGASTRVDRDILEKLDAPITHLLRNAIDHGVEIPDMRVRAGKKEEGTLYVEARHSAGMLMVMVGDDGAGIDCNQVRSAAVRRGLVSAGTAEKLGESEILEFLFLPGFSMKDRVTEISGRGVGLDVVRDMVKAVRGKVRIHTEVGRGTRFQLELPLTLSVLRVLMVLIGGQKYAFPLSAISRTVVMDSENIMEFEGRPAVEIDGKHIGLVNATEILGTMDSKVKPGQKMEIVLVDRGGDTFAVVVDEFLGQREVVVHPLDSRLGKVHDISAGTILDDGTLALILDVEDMVHSIGDLINGGGLREARASEGKDDGDSVIKRILVVDDSLTVRELERKLLAIRGYEVEVAVDGREGWNKLLQSNFDLVVTDVDMPRMDGIELVTTIKKDPKLREIPVMIVSYKDREEDRQKGLEAGADYYLGKGSFHDEVLVQVVEDLIGPPVRESEKK